MSDDNNAVVAESSPAPDSNQVLASMTSEERSDWKLTGKIPEPKPQESAPADTSKETDSVAADTAKPESDAGKQTAQEHKGKPGAESRIQQLIAEKKELQKRLESIESAKAANTEAKPAATEEKKADEPKRLSENEFFEQNPTKEYSDYLEYITDFKVEQKIREKAAADAKAETERKQKEKSQELEKSWKSKVDAAIEAHDDFKTVVTKELFDSIKPGTVLDGWVVDSDKGAEIVYHFAKNPDEFNEFLALTPFAQARKLTKLEDKLSGESVSEPEKKAPVTPVTKASKPASEVGGHAAPPEDAVASAVKSNNYSAYKAAQDKKDLERLRRG